MKKKIIVNDRRQKNYIYYRTEPIGENFDDEFKPDLTPEEMLKLGIFGGQYFSDQPKEFPKKWFSGVVFTQSNKPEAHLNYFKVN